MHASFVCSESLKWCMNAAGDRAELAYTIVRSDYDAEKILCRTRDGNAYQEDLIQARS